MSESDALPVDQVICGDALAVLKSLPENSVDAICCDPPAGISFMSKNWDNPNTFPLRERKNGQGSTFGKSMTEGPEWSYSNKSRDAFISFMTEVFSLAIKCLKPGGHALVWSLPRTSHYTAWSLENAGFEVRDVVYNLYATDAKLAAFYDSLSQEQRNVFTQLVESQESSGVLHVFGCLSEDTEILTSEGWEQYQTLSTRHHALCYNVNSKKLGWEPIQEVLTYDYSDTAYHIHSDHTDQIVSRNHRCLVERSGEYVFKQAESLECYESVPILEDMRGVLEALSMHRQSGSREAGDMLCSLQGQVCPDATGKDSREESTRQHQVSLAIDQALRSMRQSLPVHDQISGCSKEDVLKRMLSTYNQPTMEGQTSQDKTPRSLPYMQETIQAWTKERQEAILFNGMLRAMESNRSINTPTPEEDRWQWQVRMVRGDERDVSSQEYGREQSGLEGWSNLLQETRQLHQREVCTMSTGVHQHGTQGWLCDGTPFDGGTSYRASIAESGSSTSYRSQPTKQRSEQPTIVCEQSGPQATRASRFTRPDLAQVTPIHYDGVVWCVRVPSGAFVARRNGKVFITGNSGFPKSTAIDKQIDKLAPRQGMFTAFAEHFKAQRETSGLSQKQIAEHFPSKTGGMTGCVWNWENGANVPTLEQWHILQPMLNLSDEYTPLIERIEEEREVIGHNNRPAGWFTAGDGHDITLPASEAAKRYRGFGSALKPAAENWLLVRKPLSEKTLAENVLRWNGCGGLNIDATRVGAHEYTQEQWEKKGLARTKAEGYRYTPSVTPVPGKRFPSHLLLTHSIFCQPRGTKRVRGGGGPAGLRGSTPGSNVYGKYARDGLQISHRDENNEEEVQDWQCADGCPVKQLGDMSGEKQTSFRTSPRTRAGKAKFDGIFNNGEIYNSTIDQYGGFKDEGTAARYFQQFPPNDTEEWECDDSCPVRIMGEQSGITHTHAGTYRRSKEDAELSGNAWSISPHPDGWVTSAGDKGTAARYFQQFSPNDAEEWECDDSCPVRIMGEQSGERKSGGRVHPIGESDMGTWRAMEGLPNTSRRTKESQYEASEGTAARYFQQFSPHSSDSPPDEHEHDALEQAPPFAYFSKASRKDRSSNGAVNNTHPTAKNTSLVRYLIRLICREGGIVLDPFFGSGTTGVSCLLENRSFIGVEQSSEYVEIARKRIEATKRQIAGAQSFIPPQPKKAKRSKPIEPAPAKSEQTMLWEVQE